MSSTTINEKIDPSTAFATLEEACDVLEAGTEALARSITKDQGGDFNLVRAVWDGQKYLSQACREAPTVGGDDLWPRVRVVKARAEEVLARSKRFADAAKRFREAQATKQNGHRVDGPEPVVSIPQYLGKENHSAERAKREAERRARQLARSGRKGGPAISKSGDGKGKKKGNRR